MQSPYFNYYYYNWSPSIYSPAGRAELLKVELQRFTPPFIFSTKGFFLIAAEGNNA